MRSDAELLDAWRAGDRRAANELVDRHFAAIARFFRNKVRGGLVGRLRSGGAAAGQRRRRRARAQAEPPASTRCPRR